MTTHTRRGELLPLFLEFDDQELFPDLLPRPDGTRLAQGILFAIVLCLPVWGLVLWAAACR